MYVIKRSGEREEFDPRKTRSALLKAGVTSREADNVLDLLEPKLYDGITTEEIYRQLNMMLDSHRKVRFGIKKSILALGPEGYYFEDFISRLFEEMGYEVKTRQTLQGTCVSHEIDVLLKKDGKKGMVECKFHNSQGIKCSIQTVLYTYGRFMDVSQTEGLESVWLVTNTRFSSDVIQYARCKKMDLLGWKFPEETGLESMIEKYKLYPVTVVDIKRSDIKTLLENRIVLAQDIIDQKDLVRQLLPATNVKKLVDDISSVIG